LEYLSIITDLFNFKVDVNSCAGNEKSPSNILKYCIVCALETQASLSLLYLLMAFSIYLVQIGSFLACSTVVELGETSLATLVNWLLNSPVSWFCSHFKVIKQVKYFFWSPIITTFDIPGASVLI